MAMLNNQRVSTQPKVSDERNHCYHGQSVCSTHGIEEEQGAWPLFALLTGTDCCVVADNFTLNACLILEHDIWSTTNWVEEDLNGETWDSWENHGKNVREQTSMLIGDLS